jgi:ADP-ribose pyrophosphatase YjhB (NUDIX family)
MQIDQVISTVDVVILTVIDGRLHTALQMRPDGKEEPCPGLLGLIGGMIWTKDDDSADETALRNLKVKAGLEGVFIEQLRTFSGPSRDPRGWSLSIAYFALVRADLLADAVSSGRLVTMDVDQAMTTRLAFDHVDIVRTAVERVRGKGAYSVLPARLLPDTFTMSQLEETYEAVTDQHIDSTNFRRKILALGILEETGETTNNSEVKRPTRTFKLKAGTHDVFDRKL